MELKETQLLSLPATDNSEYFTDCFKSAQQSQLSVPRLW